MIDNLEHARTPEGERLSAILRVGEREHLVRFTTAGPVARGVEPFLTLALPAAMKLGVPLETAEPVSPRLLANIGPAQKVFRWMDPELKEIEVKAGEGAAHVAEAGRGAGLFFSGGVDSFHSLFARADEITDLVFVSGLDIPLEQGWLRRRCEHLYRAVAESLGKNLVLVEADVRGFTDACASWAWHMHGPALGAVAQLLAPRLERMYVAGELTPPDDPVPFRSASRVEIDPLWSTESVAVVYVGHDVSRAEKIGRIGGREQVRRALRVCWQAESGAYNCCACAKCLRNMMVLRAYGVLEEMLSFGRPLDLDKLRHVWNGDEMHWRMFEAAREIARSRGGDPELEAVIDEVLARGRDNVQPPPTPLEKAIRDGEQWRQEALEAREEQARLVREVEGRRAEVESCRREIARLGDALAAERREGRFRTVERDRVYGELLRTGELLRAVNTERDELWTERRRLVESRLFRLARRIGLLPGTGPDGHR